MLIATEFVEFFNPQSNPQTMMSRATSEYFGSPRGHRSPGRSTEILNRSAGPTKSATLSHKRIRPAIDRGLEHHLVIRVPGLRPPLEMNFDRLDQRG
jgi:hypothetical protein